MPPSRDPAPAPDLMNPMDEAARVLTLHALGLLDTTPESTCDEAVQLAAAICGTPVAIVNLLDSDGQGIKACVGFPRTEARDKDGQCRHTLSHTSPLVVPDTFRDPAYAKNRYVMGEPNVRFYAEMPLKTSEGHTMGSLCVADTVPHELTFEQTESLSALGRQIAAQLELRAKVELLAEVVQQKERMERELRERTSLFTAFMDHSPTAGFIKDPEGRFLYYNRLFCERFAVTRTEWIGKSVFDLFPLEFAAAYHELDMAVLQSGVPQVVEESSPGPQNTTLFWRTHKFRIDDGGSRGLLGGLSLDISDQREASALLRHTNAELETANEMLTELSQTDALTGLRNRRYFDDRLASCTADNFPFSLVLLDIDHFKHLNDSFGHAAGDAVLRMVASLLKEQCRPADEIARIGGEEFAVLLPRTLGEQALPIADRLRATIAGFAWRDRPVTLCAGVVTSSGRAGNAGEIMAAADKALYRAKRGGRNRVEAVEPTGEEAVGVLQCWAAA